MQRVIVIQKMKYGVLPKEKKKEELQSSTFMKVGKTKMGEKKK